jgi:predicted O-methyltransferase YrrM
MDVKPLRSFKLRAKALVSDAIRRYHRLSPSFIELVAGSATRPGPIFAKEALFLHALTRLVMPQTVLEIGVGFAASTLAFAEALRLNGRGHLISIDTNPYPIARAKLLLKVHGLDRYTTFILGPSNDPDTRQRVLELASQIGIVFIDGDHSFSACRRDFDCYRDLLQPDGLCLFHDTGPFPPEQFDLVMSLPREIGSGRPIWNEARSGIYHRPDVARVIDGIIRDHSEYSLLSLHTLSEPSCGIAILQKTQQLYLPELGEVP